MCAFSSSEGKQLFTDWLQHVAKPLGFKTFMDIGCGAGQYGEIIRTVFGKEVYVHAVDVFEEYITRHSLSEKYDVVLTRDIREVADSLNAYDLIVCGDCIEHMPKADAVKVVNILSSKCKFLWGALPIRIGRPWSMGYNQAPDEWVENPYNEHLHDYTGEEIQECFKPLFLVPFITTGSFLIEGGIACSIY